MAEGGHLKDTLGRWGIPGWLTAIIGGAVAIGKLVYNALDAYGNAQTGREVVGELSKNQTAWWLVDPTSIIRAWWLPLILIVFGFALVLLQGYVNSRKNRDVGATSTAIVPVIERLLSQVDRQLTKLFGDRLEYDASKHAVDELASEARSHETQIAGELHGLLGEATGAAYEVCTYIRMRDARDAAPSARDHYDRVAREKHERFKEVRKKVIDHLKAFRAAHPDTPALAVRPPITTAGVINPIAKALSTAYETSLSALAYLDGWPEQARSDSLTALHQDANVLAEAFEERKHQLDPMTRDLVDYCIRYLRGMVSHGFDGHNQQARESCAEFHEHREKAVRRFERILSGA